MIPRPPESEVRAQAAAVANALREFEAAREARELDQEQLKEELGDTAEELRDLLARAKKALNGTGRFRTKRMTE